MLHFKTSLALGHKVTVVCVDKKVDNKSKQQLIICKKEGIYTYSKN